MVVPFRCVVFAKGPLGSSDPGVSKRAHRRVMVAVFGRAGEWWHREILPDHFEEHSKFKYRHDRRSDRYLARKQDAYEKGYGPRVFGGPVIAGKKIDNVLTGQLKKNLQGHKTLAVYPTRVTIRMFGPTYITMTPMRAIGKKAGSKQPDKAKEITTVTADQRRELAMVMERTYTREINREQSKSRKTIG